MNIEDAKTEIRRAVSIYLRKDGYGNYRIPVEKQRPVFMIGAPGIGKTAIMEQIARELDLLLVSYSMTHHTRQSAIGLPFIVRRTYGGEAYDVSEYTMSEIVASVYESMEKSGKKEGILFLDEINCVSETLAPSMLRFLQYKTFGNQRIPRGWVIVTAGNPPEFNRSVREFDVVTLDRLKVLNVEPDYETWKRYAAAKGIHRSVQSYLDVRTEDFYRIESDADGKSYVTARGWEDLAEAIALYEEMDYPVDVRLVGQYIRNRRIAGEFATYYEIYRKYRSDYRIRDILAGEEIPEIEARASSAGFDEKLTVTELLLEALLPEMITCSEHEESVRGLLASLSEIRDGLDGRDGAYVTEQLARIRDGRTEEAEKEEMVHGLDASRRRVLADQAAFAGECLRAVRMKDPGAALSAAEAFSTVRALYQERVASLRAETAETEKHLAGLFRFAEKCFGDANEMLVIVTELTVNGRAASFIAEHGSDEYYRYQKRFMLHERSRELQRKVGRIGDVP